MGSEGLSYQDLIVCLSKECSQLDSRRARVELCGSWKTIQYYSQCEKTGSELLPDDEGKART